MSSAQRNLHPEQVSCSAEKSSDTEVTSRFFLPSAVSLQSVLELLQSYQTILQAGVNFARLLNIPLASDHKAAGLGPLFSSPDPHVVKSGRTRDTPIRWVDVVRSSVFDAELQDDGKYHVRIDKDNVVLELSKMDYDFIGTTIPRQLADPHSYSGDLALEINAAQLAFDQISHWQDIVGQLSHTAENVLGDVTQRLEFLKGKLGSLESQADRYRYSSTVENGSPTGFRQTHPPSSVPKSKKRKVRGGPGLPWSHDEVEKLPGWYKDHRHLPNSVIEEEYRAFSNKERSYSSLQSQLYKLGVGELTNRKDGTSLKRKAQGEVSISMPNTSAFDSPFTSINPGQLSKAIKTISKSASSYGAPELETRKDKPSPLCSAQSPYKPNDADHSSWLTERPPENGEVTRYQGCDLSDENVNRPEQTSQIDSPHEESITVFDELQLLTLRSSGQSLNDDGLSASREILPENDPGVSISVPRSLTVSSVGIAVTPVQSLQQSTDGHHGNLSPKVAATQTVAGHETDVAKERASLSEQYTRMTQAGQADEDDSACTYVGHAERHEGGNHQDTASLLENDCQNSLKASSGIKQKPKRAYKPRTKTGCITCRRRKKKCDEKRPSCGNCLRTGSDCAGYTTPQHDDISLASGAGISTQRPVQSLARILPKAIDPCSGRYPPNRYPPNGQRQPNEPADNISFTGPPTVTQASGMFNFPQRMRSLSLGSLSIPEFKRPQEQLPLPSESPPRDGHSSPRYHNHNIPSIQHLLRDLDSEKDMGRFLE